MFIDLRIIADLQVNPSWSRIFSRKRILPTEQCHMWISRLSSSMRIWWHWVSRETQLPWRSTTFWLRLVQLLLCPGIWFIFISIYSYWIQKNAEKYVFFSVKDNSNFIFSYTFFMYFSSSGDQPEARKHEIFRIIWNFRPKLRAEDPAKRIPSLSLHVQLQHSRPLMH